VAKDTQPRKSSLKPPSHSKKKSKVAVREERKRREQVKEVDEAAVEAWRERGKLFRAKLIMDDEETGGDSFTLSHDCEIEKYYDVAERVSKTDGRNEATTRCEIVRTHLLVFTRYCRFLSIYSRTGTRTVPFYSGR
jgi:hypothetical protein